MLLQPSGKTNKCSADGGSFQKLQETLDFARTLDKHWLRQLCACPEFLDQPFESVDIQRELQFRSFLVLLKQKQQSGKQGKKKQGDVEIVFYKPPEVVRSSSLASIGRRKKAMHSRTVTLHFQKSLIHDNATKRSPSCFQDVVHEITHQSTAMMSARRKTRNQQSSQPVEDILNLGMKSDAGEPDASKGGHDLLQKFRSLRQLVVFSC